MEYSHQNKENIDLSFAFKTGIAINIVFVVLELFFGFVSNSMALVADAGHNLSDVLALGFSWFAIIISQAKPTLRFTYGFRRSTILTAILNTIILVIAMVFLLVETIGRIGKNIEVNSTNVIIVASVGIIVNGLTAWLFSKDKTRDINVRSAFLHFLADALVSLGVVIGGIIISFTGIYWIDPVITIIIILVILFSTYRLLIDSVSLALDAVPGNIDIEAVQNFIESLPGVVGIHDLHIWALDTNVAALTVHIRTDRTTDITFIDDLQRKLKDKYEIEHTTIQVESESINGCNDCGN
jgi:cobalt-zinc-cadmium efflux system protein